MLKRWLLTVTCFGLSLAACLGMFGGSTPSEMVSPGEVAEHHATIKHDCARCHTAAEQDVSWWSCIGNEEIVKSDIQKCIQCHHGQGFSAHGLAPRELRALTQRSGRGDAAVGRSPMLVGFASRLQNFSPEKNVACTACHHEHRGRNFDLTRMSNQQCQACHKQHFESFNHGHPAFKDFPYEKSTRIYFDHARHLLKYFENEEFQRLMPEGQADKACASCHEMSHNGVMVLTTGYDTMCRSCHESEIVDEEFPGVPMFALRDLANAQNGKGERAEIGEWPAVLADSPVKKIPPFMSMLLAINRAKSDRSPLPRFEDDEDYAWQIKQLFYAIAHDVKELKIRDEPYFGEAVRASMVDVISQANRSWFPNLATELKTRAAKQPLSSGTVSTGGSDLTETRNVRGWHLRESDRTVRYRPTGHADPVIKSMLDSIVRAAGSGSPDNPLTDEFVEMMQSPTASGSAENPPVASGQCLKCHSIGKSPTGTFRMNWFATRPSAVKRLTRFSHAPHVRTLHIEGCQSCHQLNDSPPELDRIFQSNYFSRIANSSWKPNPSGSVTPLSSGFAAMANSKCAKCHNESGVGQSCLKCHNYHTRSTATEHVLHDTFHHE